MAVGITAGVVVLLIAFIAMVVCCTKKKKRRRDHIPYYMDPPHMHKGSEQYYAAASHRANNWQNGTNSASNHRHSPNLPPQPGGPAWLSPPPPPPPPPMMSSGDMGSANFSSGPRLPVLPPPSPSIALGFNKSTFTYDELAEATGAFSQANLLGQGGFGFVHKGVLPNGKVIAVKSLKSGSGQGEREFQAEVEIISRVHHRHLVSLVGYCIAEGQRMLVYEFVPNNTLEYHLHGAGRPIMSWSNRIIIAMGAAKGLAYLHEDCHPRIIHRDIKAANILLDNNFEAMVADFGLAKLSSDTFTHVSTRVMGTFGYLAPEYAASGKLTEKSDVFSYGVMLLELITGRRPVDVTNSYMEDSLVDWARPLLKKSQEENKFDELADPMMEGNFDHNEMRRMVACAAASIRHSAKRRPKMSQIVRALEGDVSLEDLNESTRPRSSSQISSPTTTEFNTEVYNENLKQHKKLALDYGSDSNQTGEFGVNNDNSTTTSGEATSSSEFGRQRSGR
ncbi:hypothetical protein Scep_020651 [Stephania cephalantha]|uniref:non-specific serine/threonine protein kinase n=1 Tax=Stephania cephalantha TaxID=152367 RepID=A0AAP0IEA5_9MAGN